VYQKVELRTSEGISFLLPGGHTWQLFGLSLDQNGCLTRENKMMVKLLDNLVTASYNMCDMYSRNIPYLGHCNKYCTCQDSNVIGNTTVYCLIGQDQNLNSICIFINMPKIILNFCEIRHACSTCIYVTMITA
jgi:hypothetical protein